MNCQVDALPIVSLPLASRHPSDLFTPLSEKIHTVILKLRSERAPGIDGISVEMLVLGGDETIC